MFIKDGKRQKNGLVYNDIVPTVVELKGGELSVMDVFSRLMADRIIFLGTPIDDYVANVIVAQLLFLNQQSDTDPIYLYINSPGGDVYSGLSIYDTMQYVKNPIHTITTGMAASMAYILAIAGEPGCRMSLRHSRFMQHQPLSGVSGDASDIRIVSKEVDGVEKDLYEIIAKHTGKSVNKVRKDCDRDYWMRAEEAKNYGAIDSII